MKVGIIGGDASNPQHLQLVDNLLEELIKESGCYLFTMFSARMKGCDATEKPLAHQYATLRGLPCCFAQYPTFDSLVNGICKEVDYLIVLYDKSQPVKRCFMAFQQTGKHGSLIQI